MSRPAKHDGRTGNAVISLRVAMDAMDDAHRRKREAFDIARDRMEERDSTLNEACAYAGTAIATDRLDQAKRDLIEAARTLLREFADAEGALR